MDETTTVNAADLLKRAGEVPKDMVLEENNPLESIPTLGVGKEIVAGTVLAGWYEGTETITSNKFKKAQKKSPEGIPQQDRHILRLVSGEKLAIWNTGGLGLFFGKREVGDFVRVKYTGKGENEQGNDQHFFDFEVGRKTGH